MTCLDPKTVEEQLLNENMLREREGKIPFQYFVPYRFLRRRIAGTHPEEARDDDTAFFNPKSREETASNNELRAALKRYIFIKARGKELDMLLKKENTNVYQTLWYYRDRSKRRVTVPHAAMEQFISACCDKRIHFEIWPALDSLEENDEVILNTTYFKGYKARVLEVRHDKNGCQLKVGFYLFRGAMLMNLDDLRPQDVIYEKKDTRGTVRESNRYKFIEDLQRKLFVVASHRLGKEPSDKVRRRDASTLELLYTYRFHTFGSEVMQYKFEALMLLCALLRGDVFGKMELAEKVQSALEAINHRPDGKISVDLRAFLCSILYLATRIPAYKETALEYFGSHAKLSDTHKQLIRLLHKFKHQSP